MPIFVTKLLFHFNPRSKTMRTRAIACAALASLCCVQTHAHLHDMSRLYDFEAAEQQKALIETEKIPVLAARGVLNPAKHPPHPRTARALEEQQWRPLRIHVDYVDLSAFSASEKAYFKTNVVEPAVAIVKDTLRVR